MTAARIVALAVALSVAQAASLKPEAAKAWEAYVESVSGGIRESANAPAGFLKMDGTPAVAAEVHRGQIVVSPAAAHIPKKVPSGLIHDWIGTAFLANTTIKDVIAILRDYSKYSEVYAPHVLESRVISTGETVDLFSVVLMNRSVLSKTALDCDYDRHLFRELQIARITPVELKHLTDEGRAPTIVDLRIEIEKRDGRIPGAVELAYLDSLPEHLKVGEFVLYCSCPNEVASVQAALKLKRRGVRHVRPLEGGFAGWLELGFPIANRIALIRVR